MRKNIRLLKHAVLITGFLICAVFIFISLKWIFHLYDIQKLNKTAAKVDQAIKDEELYLLSQSKQLEQSPTLFQYIKNNDTLNLLSFLDDEVRNRNLDSILVVDKDGVVLARTGNVTKSGDYIYDTSLWGQTLANGKNVATAIIGRGWPLAIIGAQPLVKDGKVLQSIVPVYTLNDSYAGRFKARYLNQSNEVAFFSHKAGVIGDSFQDQNSKSLISKYFNLAVIDAADTIFTKEINIGGKYFLVKKIKLDSLEGSIGEIVVFQQTDHRTPSGIFALICALFIFRYMRYLFPKTIYKNILIGLGTLVSAFYVSMWILNAVPSVIKPIPYVVYNSTVDLDPASATFSQSSEQTFAIKVYPGGEAINAAEVVVLYDPSMIEVKDILTNNSFCDPGLFIEKTVDVQKGEVRVACGLPNPGFQGRSAIVAELLVRTLKEGGFDLKFGGETKILANDGLGTNVLRLATDGHYNVFARETGLKVFSLSHPNSNRWYQSKNVNFYWRSDKSLQFAFSFNQNPNDIPNKNNLTIKDSAYFEASSDGIFYFNLISFSRGKVDTIAHYQVKIDSTPPSAPIIKISNNSPAPGEVVRFEFSNKDNLDNLLRAFYVKIDDAVFFPVGSDFTTVFYTAGRHNITVRLYDKGDNFTDSAIVINVTPPK